MGKGQQKRAQVLARGGLDQITRLEKEVQKLNEDIVHEQENHKKELVDIHERWKQSKQAHQKNNSIEEAKKKIEGYEKKMNQIRILAKKGELEIVERDKKIKDLEDILNTTRTDTLRNNEFYIHQIKHYKTRIEDILKEKKSIDELYMKEQSISDKKRREMVRAEQENLRSSITDEIREEFEIKFRIDFESLNEKFLNSIKADHKRRRALVNRRNKEYVELTAKHEKSIDINEKMRITLEKEKEENAKLYHECESMKMERKKLIRDIDSAKKDYSETEESVKMKKEELGIIQKGTEEAIEEYRIKNGEIKVLYYTLDDSEHERFYDNDTQDEIRQGVVGPDGYYRTKIGKWTYNIGLIAGVLMQINTVTKKSRPVLRKSIKISELLVPTIWTQHPGKINLLEISDSSDEFRNIKKFFMSGWYDPSDMHHRCITEFQITRIENRPVWGKYNIAEYEHTNPIRQRHDWDHSLCHKENEYLCWHGTNKIKATNGEDGIVEVGAKIYYSGTGAGCMYGQGFYGANQSKKADQYSGHGYSTMLLCGFNMGKTYHTNSHHQDARRPPDKHDSIYAAGGVANYGAQVHDEFIIFDSDQVYPYYIVEYR